MLGVLANVHLSSGHSRASQTANGNSFDFDVRCSFCSLACSGRHGPSPSQEHSSGPFNTKLAVEVEVAEVHSQVSQSASQSVGQSFAHRCWSLLNAAQLRCILSALVCRSDHSFAPQPPQQMQSHGAMANFFTSKLGWPLLRAAS